MKAELTEVFQILADGAEREEEMVAQKLPKNLIDEDWLPGLVSESVILRDLTALTWQRRRHGRVTLAPTRVN